MKPPEPATDTLEKSDSFLSKRNSTTISAHTETAITTFEKIDPVPFISFIYATASIATLATASRDTTDGMLMQQKSSQYMS